MRSETEAAMRAHGGGGNVDAAGNHRHLHYTGSDSRNQGPAVAAPRDRYPGVERILTKAGACILTIGYTTACSMAPTGRASGESELALRPSSLSRR